MLYAPQAYRAGEDPQLKRAVKEALRQQLEAQQREQQVLQVRQQLQRHLTQQDPHNALVSGGGLTPHIVAAAEAPLPPTVPGSNVASIPGTPTAAAHHPQRPPAVVEPKQQSSPNSDVSNSKASTLELSSRANIQQEGGGGAAADEDERVELVSEFRLEGARVASEFSLGKYEKQQDKLTVGVRGKLPKGLVPHVFTQCASLPPLPPSLPPSLLRSFASSCAPDSTAIPPAELQVRIPSRSFLCAK